MTLCVVQNYDAVTTSNDEKNDDFISICI